MLNNILNWGNYQFQDENSVNMIGIRDLHDYILFYLIIIFLIVSFFLLKLLINTNIHKTNDLNHNSILEFIWTMTPTFILLIIIIPSIKLLYNIDEILNPLLTIKIIGNQWYWSYEVLDNIFSSYLNDEYQYFKYLEVDNPLYLPINIPIRLIVTASDVIHSWALPSLGVKIDAIPGRLNQGSIYILNEGTYFGQCSELCGLGHAYMPIQVNAVDNTTFFYANNYNLDMN